MDTWSALLVLVIERADPRLRPPKLFTKEGQPKASGVCVWWGGGLSSEPERSSPSAACPISACLLSPSRPRLFTCLCLLADHPPLTRTATMCWCAPNAGATGAGETNVRGVGDPTLALRYDLLMKVSTKATTFTAACLGLHEQLLLISSFNSDIITPLL